MTAGAQELRRCSTSSIFDALDELDPPHGGALDGLRIFGTRARAAGPVEIVSAEVALVRRYPVEDFSIGEQIRVTAPGSILLIDLLGESVSSWGALATRSAMHHRLEACVIRGGARDVEEIDGLDFLLAVQHVTPRTGKGRIRFTGRGAALQWGSTRVETGDWMVVDRTGAVVIPAHRVNDVTRRALELERADSRFAQLLEQGEDFDDARRRLGHF
jgi:4-hydroxy-4-methyl-2-oxoglutarate aldolase